MLLASCFRLSWLNSYFPARSLKTAECLKACVRVCVLCALLAGMLGQGAAGGNRIYPGKEEENRDESKENT